MKSSKTYVWSFLGRLSHWLLVSSFFACYITSFYEELLTLHVSLGIIVFGMLLKKIVWGIIGPKYARWSDYHFSYSDLKFYFLEKIRNRYREIQPGHNPASSWFAFLVTWIGIICCISGYILYGMQENSGFLSFINKNYYQYSNVYENIHIILVYVLIVMICTHITGVLIEQFYHKTSMVFAMITGYKKAKGQNIETTFCMKFYGSLYIVVVFLIALYSYYSPQNFIVEDKFVKIDYKKLNKDFQFECSDCHNLFPPYLLPKASWVELMKAQHDHYGEDLELDDEMVETIQEYLLANSAETSTQESAYYLYKEIKNSKQYTITKTNYWKKIHQDIPDNIFKSDKIETKSNCMGCHKEFENGLLLDRLINLPKNVTKM